MAQTADSRPQPPDAQVKSAVEVCKHLRKAVHGRSIYALGHSILRDFIASLHQKINEYIEAYDVLELTIGSMNPMLGAKPLLQEEKRNASLTHRLFLQGVERVVIKEGVTSEEVEALIDLWHETLIEDEDADHNFATRFWELELAFIEVHAVAPYADNPNLSAEDRQKNEERIAKMIDRIVDRSSDPSRATLDPDELRKSAREDLRQGLDGLDSLGAAQRAGLDARITAAHTLVPPPDIWTELLKIDGEDIVRRAVAALLGIAPLADEDEVHAISQTLARILRAFVEAKQPQEAAKLVERTHDLVQDVLGSRDIRVQAWESLLSALESDDVLSAALTLMDDPAHTDACFSLLFFARPEAAPKLLGALPQMTQDEARHMLAILVREREPASVDVIALAAITGPEVYKELLFIVENYGRRVVRDLLAAGIQHESLEVKRLAHGAVQKDMQAELAPAYRTVLAHTDPALRRAARDVVVRAKDSEAGPGLAALYNAKGVDPLEQRNLIAALGAVGGPAAGKALREIVEGGGELELRIAAASGLALVADADSIKLLQAYSKKFLIRGALKDACREALERALTRGQATTTATESDAAPPVVPAATNRASTNRASTDTATSAAPLAAPRPGPAPMAVARTDDDVDVATEIEDDDDDAGDDFEDDDEVEGARGHAAADDDEVAMEDDAEPEQDAEAPSDEDVDDEDSVLVDEPKEGDVFVHQRPRLDKPTAKKPKATGPSEQVRQAMKQAEVDNKVQAEQRKKELAEKKRLDEERHQRVLEQRRIDEEKKQAAAEAEQRRRANEATRESAARLKEKLKGMKKERRQGALNAPIQGSAPVNRHRVAPTPDSRPDDLEAQQAAGLKRRRAKGMPDFGQMFTSYVVYEASEGSVVFGRKYGHDVFDVHQYAAEDIEGAYAAFLAEKAREGFVPQTDRMVKTTADIDMVPIDIELLESAYERMIGAKR